MNLNELGPKFLEQRQSQNPATASHVFKLSYYFYNKDVENIKYQDILGYIVIRRKQRAKPATINRELTILKQMFRWMVKSGILDTNPAADVSLERLNEPRDRWLTPEEETKLIGTAEDWLQPIIMFATSTGMRRGEIISLTKQQVNLGERTVTLLKSKNKTPRVIPLTKRGVAAVQQALSRPRRGNSKTSDLVFTDRRENAIIHQVIDYHFRAAVRKAGLKDFHFHDLRHTFATRLVQRGVELYVVQRLLGHKSPSMTQRYSHHSVESLRGAMKEEEE